MVSTEAEILRYFPSPPAPLPEGEGRKKIRENLCFSTYVPELYQQVTWRLLNLENHLHVPEFFLLEFGNFLGKKQRRGELTFEESLFILRKMEEVPLHWHPDGFLFPKAFQIANETYRSLYDCLYLSLAIAIDGQMVTADLKFYEALKTGPYANRLLWVEDIPQSKE